MKTWIWLHKIAISTYCNHTIFGKMKWVLFHNCEYIAFSQITIRTMNIFAACLDYWPTSSFDKLEKLEKMFRKSSYYLCIIAPCWYTISRRPDRWKLLINTHSFMCTINNSTAINIESNPGKINLQCSEDIKIITISYLKIPLDFNLCNGHCKRTSTLSVGKQWRTITVVREIFVLRKYLCVKRSC